MLKTRKCRPETDARTGKINRWMYGIAFLFPVLLALIIFICRGVWPFGTKCFLKTDLYHQYAPFLQELRYKLLNGGSLFYSWNVGLGVNFTAQFAYYLSSPENFLVALVPREYVIEFLMIAMILKLGLISVSMTKYLKYRNGGTPDIALAAFGILYALSGFMCAYYWNVMWLDCILLFPAVMYGLEALIEKEKTLPYLLTLSLCIFTNYYISIIICIFLVLWFILLNFLQVPENFPTLLKRAGRFAVASLLAGGLAAVLLVPEYMALMKTASAESTFPKSWFQYFSVAEVLERMLPAVKTEQALEHWPNVYAGCLSLLLIPLYLFSQKVKAREKTVYMIAAAIFLASFTLNVPNYIWHGLHYPNSLPGRQSFIFVFLVLVMGAEVWSVRRTIDRRQLGLGLAVVALFVILAQRCAGKDYFPLYSFYLALLMCGLYALIFRAESGRKITRTAASAFLLVLVMAEVSVNTAATSFLISDRDFYTDGNANTLQLIADRKPAENEFYRFERINRRTRNDGAWLSMPTASVFSSLTDASVQKLMAKLGCEASINAYDTDGATPLVNMLFGIRYRVDRIEHKAFYPANEPVAVEGVTALYENDSALPVGFMLPAAMTEETVFSHKNPIRIQNAIANAAGAGNVLTEDAGENLSDKKELSVTASADGEYYAWITNAKLKKVKVITPENSSECDNLDRKYLIPLGNLNAGDKVKLEPLTDGQNVTALVYRFDYDNLKKAYQTLAEYRFQPVSVSDAYLKGMIECDPARMGYTEETALACFTIPYDEGWSCYVDGKKTETERVFDDAFLGIRLEKGMHTIELRYVPCGLVTGLTVTILCLFLTLFLAALEKERTERRAKKELRNVKM